MSDTAFQLIASYPNSIVARLDGLNAEAISVQRIQ